MEVFISWSGDRSKAVAKLLKEWLGDVIQYVDPWISTEMDRGSAWFEQILNQLGKTSFGIVCLTAENQHEPWIQFESGAIAKRLDKSWVCTLLVDLGYTDVKGPLQNFNHTSPGDKESMRLLISTLNGALGEDGLKADKLDRAFETHWGTFKARFDRALSGNQPNQPKAERNANDLMIEILGTVRSIDHRLVHVKLPGAPLISEDVDRTNIKNVLPYQYWERIQQLTILLELKQGTSEDEIRSMLIHNGVEPMFAELAVRKAVEELKAE